MTRLIPILLLVIGVFVMIRVSSWHTGRTLRRRSRPLMNDQIEALLKRLARTAGIESVEVRLLDMPVVNGLATPQGEIYITQGLFRKFYSGRGPSKTSGGRKLICAGKNGANGNIRQILGGRR